MTEQDKQIRTPRKPACGQTQPDLCPDTPVFVLSDFEDYVAFHRKCDLIARSSSAIPEKMSQKKCRFCD